MAPIFVGSNSNDSRIRSNRVGFAVSTANPGSAAEGDVYFNSTDNKLRAYDGSDWANIGAGGGTFTGIASGTLANGSSVIIKTDGTVAAVTQTGSTNPSAGISTVFESGGIDDISATFDSTNGKVVVAYRDTGDSNYGKAVVGTVTGTAVTFGTPVTFNSQFTSYCGATFDSANGKVVIGYRDDGGSDYGRAVVGTVSGDTISFGSPVAFESASTLIVSAVYDSTNGKVVFAYRDAGNSSAGTAIVGTVSGTSISFGAATTFNNGNTSFISAVYDSTNGKVVIAYRDNGNSEYGTAVVGTVSGTDISFGSEVVFESAVSNYVSATFDSTNSKVVVSYSDQGNSNYGTAIVGTVSGTSISFGTPVIFDSGGSITWTGAIYDSGKEKVVIVYRDGGNSNDGTAIVGTVSGTSISFGSELVFETGTAENFSPTFDSTNGKVVTAYKGPSSTGTAVVIATDTLETNLTSSNFLGFSDAAYTNGQTATVQIVGSIDDAQTGLTTGSRHFVQNDGTLSTTAGSPSVLAGTAISATKIIIRK